MSLPLYSMDQSSHSPDPVVETQTPPSQGECHGHTAKSMWDGGALSLTSLGHTVYDRCHSHVLVIR